MTRAEAIKMLERLKNGINFEVTDSQKKMDALNMAIQALEQTRWIPVTERLPEDRRTVLVTACWHETYQVMEASYFGDGLWWCVPFNNTGKHEQKLNPKAWMPLPEPYLTDV